MCTEQFAASLTVLEVTENMKEIYNSQSQEQSGDTAIVALRVHLLTLFKSRRVVDE